MANTYYEETKEAYYLKLRGIQKDLPRFTDEFFRGISDSTSIKTQIAYAYDLRIFFNYLLSEELEFSDCDMKTFSIEDFKRITIDHLESYMYQLSYYTKVVNGKNVAVTNEERGKNRKISAVRTMFTYYYKKRKIEANPSELITMPKIHDKNITVLDVEEIKKLLEEIESGNNLTKNQKRFHKYTSVRDLAIITLLLGTGMRISECIGIDLNDIDFEHNAVKITRKGGNESVLYFGEEVREALCDYYDQREELTPAEGYENALFLSLQMKRINPRTVQMLVKKYSQIITPLKKISPHKLRSTYGTSLYRECGDIYLVADVLGHRDVNTTKKHYARLDDDRRREAAQYVNLRNKE